VEFLATADHAVASQEQPTADAQRLFRRGERASQEQPNADAQRLFRRGERASLAQERYYSTWDYGDTFAAVSDEPSAQHRWLTPALGVLAAILAVVAGVAVLVARRAHRGQRAEQTA
jgi:Flp pilus assembly protein TadB